MEQISPKEKAIQLINSIFDITQRYLDNEKLALLIAEEVLNSVNVGNDITMHHADYWKEVEFEIIKYCNEKP